MIQLTYVQRPCSRGRRIGFFFSKLLLSKHKALIGILLSEEWIQFVIIP
jgi:hypothetical protein